MSTPLFKIIVTPHGTPGPSGQMFLATVNPPEFLRDYVPVYGFGFEDAARSAATLVLDELRRRLVGAGLGDLPPGLFEVPSPPTSTP